MVLSKRVLVSSLRFQLKHFAFGRVCKIYSLGRSSVRCLPFCFVWPSWNGDLCDGVWSLQKIAMNRAQRGRTTSLATMLAWRGCGRHGVAGLNTQSFYNARGILVFVLKRIAKHTGHL